MQWWCVADGETWTWAWKAYPGVWIVMLAMVVGYRLLTRNAPPGAKGVRYGWVGVVIIWLSLDWPLGPLAAGYLASAHALQFIMITFMAVPLLLMGIRDGALQHIPETGPLGRTLRVLTFPVLAGLIFNVIIIATHNAVVLDSLMVTQLGAFFNDLLWFVGAVIFWWPVIVPVPHRPRFHGFFQIIYIFLGTSFHTVLGIIMLISRYPIYGVYELAPPMSGLSAIRDLHIAGGIMELMGSAVVYPVMSYIFFQWVKKAKDEEARIDAEADQIRSQITAAELNRSRQGLEITN